MKKKLGAVLIENKFISQLTLEEALEKQKECKKRLGDLLLELGHINEEVLAQALSLQHSFPLVPLSNRVPEPRVLSLIPRNIALKYLCFPLSVDNKRLILSMADPLNHHSIEDITFLTGCEVIPVVSTKSEILTSISKFYGIEEKVTEVSEEEQKMLNPVIRMEKLILDDAVGEGASDIHIEPRVNFLGVRYRVDGLLKEVMQVPSWMQSALISRIKVGAKMDIGERRLPQDGKMTTTIKSRDVDLRISTLPTHLGEKVVIRILDKSRKLLLLDDLGLSSRGYIDLQSFVKRRDGIILVVGPTGSGKTTTLYALVNELKGEALNIVTIEDPIEYEFEGVNQVQIHEKAGLTFASVLRSVLRQDPDVIMVGEIRDKETADIAFRAAMTGHLVLSTVHTYDTAATITRLIDLGVEPYLIGSSLIGVVAQRLVRLNCPYCKEPYNPQSETLYSLNVPDTYEGAFYRGRGCEQCNEKGYKGRIGIFEVMKIDKIMKELISTKEKEHTIRETLINNGISSLRQEAINKAMEGTITLEEALRATYNESMMEYRLCPSCKKRIEESFSACPYCGNTLRIECPSCNRKLQIDWVYCPFCKGKVSPSSKRLKR